MLCSVSTGKECGNDWIFIIKQGNLLVLLVIAVFLQYLLLHISFLSYSKRVFRFTPQICCLSSDVKVFFIESVSEKNRIGVCIHVGIGQDGINIHITQITLG